MYSFCLIVPMTIGLFTQEFLDQSQERRTIELYELARVVKASGRPGVGQVSLGQIQFIASKECGSKKQIGHESSLEKRQCHAVALDQPG